MKLSKTSRILSILVGLLGILQLLSAWTVGEGGTLGSFTQGELFINAIVFMMIAIWLAHGAGFYSSRE